jgi:tRNA(Ile)-lysidine synthase
MLQHGDHVVCAVSGGADSVALLFALYLLREKLGITLSAAHFNHCLRGAESDRDEKFVRELCARYDIPLHVGSGLVEPGKKGLEAAARDARYAFLRAIPGKIATAHTADDNAETLLMHLVRGTGLKGLGAIAPVNGMLIRPMLDVTRGEVLSFLQEYSLSYVDDSTNDTDQFLRNRLRHHVMPLLTQENPGISRNLSALALRLRQDEACLAELAASDTLPDVPALRQMAPAIRSRMIDEFLKKCGVPEPEAAHIDMVEKLVFSDKPSARACLPNGTVILRNYDKLIHGSLQEQRESVQLSLNDSAILSDLGLRVSCTPAQTMQNTPECFTVVPSGQIVLRSRQAGDAMRLSGGTKDLKKLFIDRKIPASQRMQIPVIADDDGVLGVLGFGANLDRCLHNVDAVEIRFEPWVSKE